MNSPGVRCAYDPAVIVTGSDKNLSTSYQSRPICPLLSLQTADGYLDLGHKVKALFQWIASNSFNFDFLLKTDTDTLICFTMVMDKLDSLMLHYGTRERMYLGHAETCSKSELVRVRHLHLANRM